MSDVIASLTIKVASDSVKQATTGLADLSKQADATAQSTGRLNKASGEVEKAQRGAAAAMQTAVGAGAQSAATNTRAANAAQQLGRATTTATTSLTQESAALRAVLGAAASTATATERLRASTAGATAAATRHAASMRDQAKAAQDAGTQSGRFSAALGRVQGIAGPLGITLGAAFAVQTISRAVTGALQLADGFAQVGQRVRLFSSSAENARDVQRQLVALAVQNRAPLEDVAGIYTRISAVSEDLNASQQQVLTVTKAVAQTFTLSGASAAQAAASGQQLAQALGSGTLAGDELKSIMENNLVLAQAIAKGFGVSVGELKKMGAEGKLTSEGVFKALLSQADELAKRAGTIGPTLNGGLQTFNTGLLVAIGRLDDMLGITKLLGVALDAVGKTLAGQESQLGSTANPLGGGAGYTAGYIPGRKQESPAERAARERRAAEGLVFGAQSQTNPLFMPGGRVFTPIEEATRGSAFDTRQALGLPVREFGSGPAAAGKDELRNLYEKRAADAKRASTDAKKTLDAALDAQIEEFQGLRELTQRRFERIGKAADAFVQANFTARAGGDPDDKGSQAPLAKGSKAAIDGMRQSSEDAKAVFQSLVNGLQTTFSNGLQGLFTKGLSSVNDFARSIKDTILRAFSDILASAITKRLLSALANLGGNGGGSLAGSTGSGGGLLGSLVQIGGMKAGSALLGKLGIGGASKIGNIGGAAKAGGAAGSAGGFSLGGSAAGAGAGFLIGNAVGQRNGTTAGVLSGAASGALIGAQFGGPIGAGIGFVVGGIGGLLGGNAKKKKQQEAARQLAADSAAFADELIARSLEASGDELGAQKKRLVQQQKTELDAVAARFGKGSRQVFQLMELQKKELEKLGASDSALASGTYLAPSGFSANAYRFNAGRPTTPTTTSTPITITGDVKFELPAGTSREMAQDVVRQLQGMATSQGLAPTDWNRVDVQ